MFFIQIFDLISEGLSKVRVRSLGSIKQELEMQILTKSFLPFLAPLPFSSTIRCRPDPSLLQLLHLVLIDVRDGAKGRYEEGERDLRDESQEFEGKGGDLDD